MAVGHSGGVLPCSSAVADKYRYRKRYIVHVKENEYIDVCITIPVHYSIAKILHRYGSVLIGQSDGDDIQLDSHQTEWKIWSVEVLIISAISGLLDNKQIYNR